MVSYLGYAQVLDDGTLEADQWSSVLPVACVWVWRVEVFIRVSLAWRRTLGFLEGCSV